MELLRPKKIFTIKKGGSFQAAFSCVVSRNYTFTENGVEVTKTIDILYFSEPVSQFEAKLPKIGIIQLDNIEKYYNFQNLINHCINNAEFINSLLRNFLLSIFVCEEIKSLDSNNKCNFSNLGSQV